MLMASKNNIKTKGLGKDPSLGKMGQRMITTMLREERIAERDLQEKLKAISDKEHKTMVKLNCDSLDVRHDLTLHRSNSPLSWEHGNAPESTDDRESFSDFGESFSRPKLGRKAVSMLTFQKKQESATDFKRSKSEEAKNKTKTPSKGPSIFVEKHNEKPVQDQYNINANQMKHLSLNEKSRMQADTSFDGRPSSPRSPRLLQRRPVSDIGAYSVHQPDDDDEEVFVKDILLGKGVCNEKQFMPKAPSTPPPVRRNLNSLSADTKKPRSFSARSGRSRTPVRGSVGERLDLPQNIKQRGRSPSPSPSRLSPDLSMVNLGRRGSAPPKIDASKLPTNSLLRKAMASNDVSLRPGSPEALRKRFSSTEEDLQGRVSEFLKSLPKK